MATAKKLPSGNYRALVYIGLKDGKRQYKSFTDPDKWAAEHMASAFRTEQQAALAPENMTVGQAIDRYIESKDAVLSPSTINAYRKLRRLAFRGLTDCPLGLLSNAIVQRAVNDYAAGKAPKTVRNAYGLLVATLKAYYPGLKLNITLPQKQKVELYIPNDEEVASLLAASKPPLRLAILLAAHLGLRRSEICALAVSDFTDGVVTISKAKVQAPDASWVVKVPKSYAGHRKISVPPHILRELPEEGVIFTPSPEALSQSFRGLQVSVFGAQRFRFHDLRHYNASVMLAQGVPNKYAQERLGHATDNMLKTVYQHLFQNKQNEVADALNAYFSKALQHEIQHEKRKGT